ncbi:S9 family peptidase [Longimicrobium sp.]|uniref:S9 family peptidase n=1 Tax=Longimicrobium sp. TaxID=2029185 RepID=UPI002E35B404|nr:S9 family peptidase [Longimicrobium sp.]HEX6041997.1 S9 family peptidase [Longimicrobium sp.]
MTTSIPVRLGIPLFAAALLALPAAAQDTIPTPAPVDVPQMEPAALSLAGSDCQGVARYLNVGSVSGAQLSPDGRQMLYLTATSGMPQVWVAPVLSSGPGMPRQITFGANRVQFARWSPDGRWIAYGTDRGGNERTQIFLLSPDGTRERELTPADDFFRLFSGWSPRGSRIAYVSNERNGRDFDLYLLDVDPDGRPAAPRMVMQGAGNLSVEAWRPDGEAVVLSQGRGEADNDLFLLDLRTQKLDTLFVPRQMSSYQGVQWTPDGEGFFVATNHERDFAGLAHVHVADRSIHWMRELRRDVESVALSPDGRYLAYTVNEDGWSRLIIHDLEGKRDVQVQGEVPGGVIGALEWASGAPRLLIGVSGPGLPGDAWVYDAPSNTVVRATESTLAGLDPASFVSPDPLEFASFDGEVIHGLMYLPRGSAGRRPPVVMMLHGGPTAQARPDFDPVTQYLLARGYAVLDLNFRGSTGYGQRFTQLDNKRLRPDAVRDMQAAVEYLRTARQDVDGNRVAAMGGSYGGYMTLAAVAQLPEYFQAGVDFVGVANWISGLEDASPQLKNSDRIEYGNIDDPQDRAFFTQISPLSYADQIRSPLMVVHGANDPRVPVGEADQIVRAVRHRRGDVEYLRFPDEGHGIARLQNRITAYQRIARFLDRVLGNEGMVCRGR